MKKLTIIIALIFLANLFAIAQTKTNANQANIVIVHGSWSSAGDWDGVAARLKADGNLVTVVIENETTIVYQTGSIESSAMAARGMVQGLPVFMAISKRDPSLIARIEEALEPALAAELGNFPLKRPLSAWIFEATK